MLGYALYLSGSFDIPDKDEKGGWIYEYQTLIGVVIAALGTLFAWYKYTAEISRKLRASKAKMPDALDELHKYCVKCYFFIGDQSSPNPLDRVPTESILVFKDAIEYEKGQNFDAIFDFIRFYQIHNSRFNYYLLNKEDTELELKARYDSVKLGMYINRVFDYALGNSNYVETREASLREMNSAFDRILERQDSNQIHEADDLVEQAIREYIENIHVN